MSLSFLNRENMPSALLDPIKMKGKSGITKLKGEELKNKLYKPSRCAFKDLRNVGMENKDMTRSAKKPKSVSEPLPSFSEGKKVEGTVIFENDSEEQWSDIEEIHNYPEPEDNYYDILPKSERLTSSDIEEFFRPPRFYKERSFSPPPLPSPILGVLLPLSPCKMPAPLLYTDMDDFSLKEMELIPFSDEEL